ncbi:MULTISPECIES: hypothetical protein [unclassified Rhodococcus (in: high G+C Gram-positive bacteria)]|uniref:hypothetical protein n=1 Tax=unclassified Rhodococcus (in: high G+C Gram-positive bacteria) TaxID=192944 RepID=UPI0021BF52A4|nr:MULTISPECIES: hypothetical protein [unclassified Rhodococcus (in: high G+C Gram-positive bacteria)]
MQALPHNRVLTIGALMLKKMLATSALAIGVTALVAAPATAEGISYPGPTDETEHYVSVFDPAAYGSLGQNTLLVSPFGTSQPIQCWSFHGQGGCWQTDLAGANHTLHFVRIPTGSSEANSRPIAIFNPFW